MSFRSLKAYEKSFEVAVNIYNLTKSFPASVDSGGSLQSAVTED